jgi:hypothetical protein
MMISISLSAYIKLIFSIIILFILLNFNQELVLENLFLTSFKLSISLSEYSLYNYFISIILFQNAVNMFDGSNLQFANFSFICILFLFYKSDFNIFFLLMSVPFIFYWYLNKNKYSFLGDSGALYLYHFFFQYFLSNFIKLI